MVWPEDSSSEDSGVHILPPPSLPRPAAVPEHSQTGSFEFLPGGHPRGSQATTPFRPPPPRHRDLPRQPQLALGAQQQQQQQPGRAAAHGARPERPAAAAPPSCTSLAPLRGGVGLAVGASLGSWAGGLSSANRAAARPQAAATAQAGALGAAARSMQEVQPAAQPRPLPQLPSHRVRAAAASEATASEAQASEALPAPSLSFWAPRDGARAQRQPPRQPQPLPPALQPPSRARAAGEGRCEEAALGGGAPAQLPARLWASRRQERQEEAHASEPPGAARSSGVLSLFDGVA
ncbi:MAG: hypothetical protein J3K34DRAFT_23413 [Monoraphidium minutum]|nr:MAG: hypothetical protein J3K34DRAFT_23413 [Monoraphidium minutum]